MAVENGSMSIRSLKILPVNWGYTIPYGQLHSPSPSAAVKKFLRAVEKATKS